MNEEKLAKELETYQQLAKQDKKIDLASLVINALQKHETNMIDIKEKRWAYIFSFFLPPLGVYYAIKFYLSDKDDGAHVAIMCLALTIVAILLVMLLSMLLTRIDFIVSNSEESPWSLP